MTTNTPDQKQDACKEAVKAHLDSLDFEAGFATFSVPDVRWTAGAYYIVPAAAYEAQQRLDIGAAIEAMAKHHWDDNYANNANGSWSETREDNREWCREYVRDKILPYFEAILTTPQAQEGDSKLLATKVRENENYQPSEMAAHHDVLAERKRQVEREGWTAEHDDEHDSGELALAAACYASPKPIYTFTPDYEDGVTGQMLFEGAWPWDSGWWKPTSRRQNLVKAGALIFAEIERIDRAALPAAPKPQAQEAGE